jgi:hypothetical protein
LLCYNIIEKMYKKVFIYISLLVGENVWLSIASDK